MRNNIEEAKNLSGSLLAAHPGMMDPNFRRAVILLSAHSGDDGALGVVINRPLGKELADFKTDFRETPLGGIPLYYGGPVGFSQDEEGSSEIILAGWKWNLDESSFQIYFGIAPDKAESLMLEDPEVEIRGFIGYSGWSSGQLEGELAQNAWVVSPLWGGMIKDENDKILWRQIIHRVKPELSLLADAPDDPSLN